MIFAHIVLIRLLLQVLLGGGFLCKRLVSALQIEVGLQILLRLKLV